MKAKLTTQFILALGIVLLSSQAQARVFRVNNRLTTSAPQFLYASLAEAQAAASAGDTIMVEGSPNAYSVEVAITKRLVIFGPGYYLVENTPKQANPATAFFSSYITFEPGSQGSLVLGLVIRDLYITTDNITVSRCKISRYLFIRQVDNPRITQNEINTILNRGGSEGPFSNGVLANNIIIAFAIRTDSQFNTVNNNIFSEQNVVIPTLAFQNNILTYNQTNFTINIISGSIRNNICAAAQLGTANGNRDYDPAANNLFVGVAGANNSPDGQYRLLANSPFIAAGVGGTQPGVFGGPTPYELSGMPPIPAIYEITTTGTGSTQSGLPITIKIKSY